jgi:hypothetical protein
MSITTSPATEATAPIIPEEAPPSPRVKPGPLMQAVQALASLRFTVVLFVLSFLLVFLGTLAQVEQGIGTVTKNYFRSFVVFIPFQTLVRFGQVFFDFPKEWRAPGSFPFPAGMTLGILLMANLLAAHAVRFKLTWARSGILITHAGLALLLLGEIQTAYFQIEGQMRIEEGESSDTVINIHKVELAVADTSGTDDDIVTTVPSGFLRKKGHKVEHADLPFDIVPVDWYVNSTLRRPDGSNPATAGDGLRKMAVSRPEVAGTEEQRADAPSMYAELIDKASGKSLGVYLFSTLIPEQKVQAGGKTYDVSLRFEHTRRPFSLYLKKFSYDRYPMTNTALNFSSLVVLKDHDLGDEREVLIRMNEPLRHRGETFFQSGWNDRTERGTVLQVVRNPGWLIPYISCAIVSLGLCMHFGLVLVGFLGRKGA